MATSTIPQAVIDQVTKTKGVMASAKLALEGFSAKLQVAVDAALANGATEAELAPVQQAINDLDADTLALANAVAANP